MRNGTETRLFAKFCLVMLFTILLGLVGQITGPAVPAAEAGIVPVGQAYGVEYGEWSARWWQWALSIPVDVNPILSDGPVDCTLGQTGNVWFLAGNFGGTSVRTCTIPAGKPLFFPVINFVVFDPFVYETILDIRKQAGPPIDAATNLSVTVDGLTLGKAILSRFRVQSPVFQVIIPTAGPPTIPGGDPVVPDPRVFLLPPGPHLTAVSDGYWVLLDPLAPGRHTIRIKSAGADGFTLDVTYNLTVTR